MIPIDQRLADKSMPEPNSGCCLWLAGIDANGYGQFWVGGRNRRAHQVAWEMRNGSIPAGMCVCHKCDVPTCVNPDHLFLGTRGDNNRDRHQKGRTVLVRGESHGRHILTADLVRAIRADTRRYADIAADFGVSRTAIGAIKLRRNWRHV